MPNDFKMKYNNECGLHASSAFYNLRC